jgi:hypothetical protein
MKIIIRCCYLFASLLMAAAAPAQDMSNEEFTDHDFEQFFGQIEGGKISLEKMIARCKQEVVGFTFAGLDLQHNGERERIDYNQTRIKGSVDGRVMRSRHYNFSFGEWTGSVFKPLCSGLWSIGVDFDASPNTRVDLYLRKPGEERPGQAILSSSSGHLSLALPLGTGDEISTYTVSVTDKPQRTIPQATFTAYKIAHIDKYMTEFDEAAWNADVEALK